jgi:hypothetical protein
VPSRRYAAIRPDRARAAGNDSGGEGGIRTHGTRKGSTVFETARFNHSRTSPSPNLPNFSTNLQILIGELLVDTQQVANLTDAGEVYGAVNMAWAKLAGQIAHAYGK